MKTINDVICNSDESSTYVMDLNKIMSTHHFMLCYKGNFNQNMIRSILSMTEKKMNNSEEDVLIKKKVFNVLVECLQNISKSSMMVEGEQALLMIGKSGDNYEIYSGNIVLKNKKSELKQILNSIASFGKEELKRLYKLLMINDTLVNGSSIEVALIDIAKKTGNNIIYEFKDLDEHTTFFSLKTVINRNS